MNISELAQHLDVAVSTVSRVLSGNAQKYRISPKTVERVKKAAAEHQVVPDPLGANLRRGKTGTIGLLVPDITNPFFSQLARVVELKIRDAGMAVQLCDSAEDPDTEVDLLTNLLSRRLDGIILAPVGVSDAHLSKILASSSLPILLLDRAVSSVSIPSISIDNKEAGFLAASHLLTKGHIQIGCLRGDPRSQSDKDRIEGVKKAFSNAGIDLKNLTIAGSGYSREESIEGASAILRSPDRPGAVISLSGQGILGILEIARELSLKIPKDLSVIAFDEQPWSALFTPPLTTISQPIDKMASKTVEILLALIEDEASVPATSHQFSAEVIERNSVAPFV